MFEELKNILNNLFYLENEIKENNKELEKLESTKITLENKLNKVINEIETLKTKTEIMLNEKRETERIANETIKNINK